MLVKQIYISTVLAIIAFVCGYLYLKINDDTHKKSTYATQINQYLGKQEAEVIRFIDDLPFIKRQVQKTTEVDVGEYDFDKLSLYERKDFTILIFQKDSLIFWSNNKVILTGKDYLDLINHPKVEYRRINNGYYEVIRDQLNVGSDIYDVAALIPLKYNYTLSSDYLLDDFTASTSKKRIPQNLKLTHEPTPFIIKSTLGDAQFYVKGDKKLSSKHHQRVLFYLFGLAGLFILITIYFVAKQIMLNYNPTLGAIFLIASIFLVRFLSISLSFSEMFSALALFEKQIDAPLSSPTIGDFLINVVLLLSIIYFFYREFHVRSFNHLPFIGKIGITIVNFFSVILSLFLVISIIKYLILNSGISYNFNNIFNLNTESQVAVLGIILMITALFLFNQRMMRTIINVNISKYQRLGCLAAGIVISIPLIQHLDFMMPAIQIVLVTLMYIVLFDLFTDYKQINLTWLVLWLVIYSGLTSGFLFKYNGDKDELIRYDYALKLAEKKDTIAEKEINSFILGLEKDKYFRQLVGVEKWSIGHYDAARTEIDKHFSDHSYLFNNYNYDVKWDMDFDAKELQKHSVPISLGYKFEEAENSYFKNIKLSFEAKKLVYLAQADVKIIRRNQYESQKLVFEFTEKLRDKTKVYTELLLNNEYKNLIYLSHYDFSIYNNGNLVRDGGNVSLERINVPPPGEFRLYKFKGEQRSELIFHDFDNVVVVIGKEIESSIKLISLFCFIFALLILFSILLAFLNTFFKFLPQNYTFSIYRKPSLRNRIQLSVIALIVASFFLIGLITVLYFKGSSEDYHENRLQRKAKAVLADAEREIQLLEERNVKSISEYASIVTPISEIHRMDINLFDLSGQLISSSDADIFNKGIVGSNMNSVAYYELNIRNKDRYTQDIENIGALEYKSMYLPLKSGNRTLFYIGLPYYDKQNSLKNDVDEFMGMLLNVYVFLLLIAGSIAILVANSITKPISKIGEKLKQFKLGGKNEPLEWNSKDELGVLIDEYNRMIQKLKDSASLLAKSEREGAWREMAKQVAHEIKNPLTPMKLSIQYLQRAYNSNPDDLGDLIKRVTNTLIEQIDNLAAIATEFSTFAKMPQAKNEKLSLNHLIGSVYDLFRERGGDTEVSLHRYNKDILVIADKNQLLRVLNNLLKNAIQAIPEERKGIISMHLMKEDNNAIIIIRDNGSGIPEEKQDKVFVPNFTTKSSGTGLGLAMSKNIIESFYGSIYFETEPNVGTSFFVKLPIAEIKAIAQEPQLA
ncbi:MAG: GHKL domain-containing protein [Bacteroidia bacterium]|nr:GHKL domain-containing protein [Bacteroidia bacterium]